MKEVNLLHKGTTGNIGSRRQIIWDTALPYTITIETELTKEIPYQKIAGRSYGELNGTGVWTFSQKDDLTIVQYDWQVQTTKRWMNLMAPLLRKLFEWNHDKVMAAGYHGLSRELSKTNVSAI